MIDSGNPLPLEEWIAADSRIAQGRPVISRTRVHVDVILAALARPHGISLEDVPASWHHYYQLAVPGGPPTRGGARVCMRERARWRAGACLGRRGSRRQKSGGLGGRGRGRTRLGEIAAGPETSTAWQISLGSHNWEIYFGGRGILVMLW